MTRRGFCAAGLAGLARKSGDAIAGGFVNESATPGHRLRGAGPFRKPSREVRAPVVIVGGGMAGLSAAWRLEKRGFRDYVLLEMEERVGGVSRWGENEVSAYPWGAHYVPVPGPHSLLIRELLADLGVLVCRGQSTGENACPTNTPANGVFDERYLCFTPQERLFLHGRWQDGLEPALGVSARHLDEYRRFEDRMRAFRASGEFTIPMERGARPSALDSGSMEDWLREQQFTSPYLRWYVDYACRDDYGASAAGTSAWAGIHYFAAREPEEKGPLTWPEGNGWIVRRLEARLKPHIRAGAMVYRMAPNGRRFRVFTEDTLYDADAVIFAAPSFLAPYLVEGAPPVTWLQYSPWLTANLTLDRLPRERGIETAWDNVIYDSPALGYVVATHQSLASQTERSVWTFYWALARGSASQNRKFLLDTDWRYWKEAILSDLERAHPDIRACVSRIDIMRLGHAMPRPTVGFLSSEERRRLAAGAGGVLYAHSDVSGFSIVEEAQYRGVTAADRALRRIGGAR